MRDFQLFRAKKITQGHFDFCGHNNSPAATPPGSIEDVFGPVIHSYSRRQAIEDGVLVQLSGEGYEGDEWIPQMVAEAGIRFPLAVTTAVFMDCIGLTKAAEKALNDIKGRLWDVLWMFSQAVRRLPEHRDQFVFELYVVRDRVRPDRVRLKAICGPGDDGEPVITIMYPHED